MTTNSLSWFNNEYEMILHSGLSDSQKGQKYGNLMTEMESTYKIPALKNEEWEKKNRPILALYRKISISRKL